MPIKIVFELIDTYPRQHKPIISSVECKSETSLSTHSAPDIALQELCNFFRQIPKDIIKRELKAKTIINFFEN